MNTTKSSQCAQNEKPVVIALAGNPNVGKSTVFNALTGMHQHTGNWPGKTVGNARGWYTFKNQIYNLVDIPGSYSLVAHSAEEEIARDFICFGEADATIIVCDATCLVRNLNLVLQILEVTDKAVVCVNLMDEAARKHIFVDCNALSEALGVPVVATCAKKNDGLETICKTVYELTHRKDQCAPKTVTYHPVVETALTEIIPLIESATSKINPRWTALMLLQNDDSLLRSMEQYLGFDLKQQEPIASVLASCYSRLEQTFPNAQSLRDDIVAHLFKAAEEICHQAVRYENKAYMQKQLRWDRLLTGKAFGIPTMILLLLFILWLTVSGANYPSALLSDWLFGLEKPLSSALLAIGTPLWLHNALVLGIYRVVAWVVSVMLPPMAIFFPLFTLLEDLGYLPRVAFNLDHCFKKCHACGKQALTMCMGFGCNAVGVTGCRIIDSPRERLLAIITNNFVPCNGRFPTIISIITMFFIVGNAGIISSFLSAAMLTGVILLGILLTIGISKLLSVTLLKGVPSSFTLELPPYRPPQVGKVIVRSIFDRTLFVLGRAVSVAAPAGLIIYIMANVTVGGNTLLAHTAGFLDPFARLFGLDGVILMAFILGFPANEIVMPIAIMAYLSGSTLTEFENLSTLKTLLVDNGWTWLTATCTMLFSLLHFPCSTTLLSIKKETGSIKWTLLGFLLPTICGMLLCFLLASTARFFGLV